MPKYTIERTEEYAILHLEYRDGVTIKIDNDVADFIEMNALTIETATPSTCTLKDMSNKFVVKSHINPKFRSKLPRIILNKFDFSRTASNRTRVIYKNGDDLDCRRSNLKIVKLTGPHPHDKQPLPKRKN